MINKSINDLLINMTTKKKRQKLTTCLDPKLIQDMKIEAAFRGVNLNIVMEEALLEKFSPKAIAS